MQQCELAMAIIQLLFILVSLAAVTKDSLLHNPSPVPLGGVATFTCSGYCATTVRGLLWTTNAVNGSQVPDTAVGNIWRSSQLHVPALPVNNNTDIHCQTFEQQNIERLYIYG